MPADAFWTLAMAVNVYLTFYYKFDASRIRKMEIWYLLICYGIPFIPAITYIFVRTEEAGRMYGNATLWCWVSSGWDIFRIATFYGPVWVVIVLTMFIYIRTGGEIYKKRKQLRNFGVSSGTHDPEPMIVDEPQPAPYAVKTTEVTITSEVVEEGSDVIDLAPLGRFAAPKKGPYSVTISADAEGPGNPAQTDESLPIQSSVPPTPSTARARGKVHKRRVNYEASNAAWSYSKCALLFFTALLVTWIPSSANRAYSVVNYNEVSPALEIMSAIVLPLQGFWNTLIYVSTSWEAVKALFTGLSGRIGSRGPEDSRNRRNYGFELSSQDGAQKDLESESIIRLTNSSGVSNSNHDAGARRM
ncbi:family A G protein-coupled receptor-like protein [Hypoxylon sp. FL1284]|nr:family A G protein-coupled receptor-like protein [Hypoxylon sp. FL1284]